jgi:glycosyltransferase involved in cell wall biosynthesis
MAPLVDNGQQNPNGNEAVDAALAQAERRRVLGSGAYSRRRPPSVGVVIPAMNEARNIPWALERLPSVDEVILVDGRSVDGTVEVARRLRPDIRVIQQSRRGKGNALLCGFAVCRADIVVAMDADGSNDPEEIPRFVDALVAGADLAKGSRFTTGGGSDDITRMRRLGNRGLSALVNGVYGTRYTDLCYGYNAFWRRCLPTLACDVDLTRPTPQWGDGFEIEAVINVRAVLGQLRIVEVPSYERRRRSGVSNLHAVGDGTRVLRAIATERQLARRRARIATPASSSVRALATVDGAKQRAGLVDLENSAEAAG